MAGDQENDTILYAYVFGATIAQLRDQRGMNQGALAKAIGVTQPTISRFERGTSVPDAQQIRLLAAALNTSASELMLLVDDAFARAKETAKSASPEVSDEGDWFPEVLRVVGMVGLVGLAGFAAALAVDAARTRQRDARDDTEGKPTDDNEK